jgi:putative membrane protein insertion efficiency factor
MRRVWPFLVRLPRLLLIGVVRAYQLLLSPHLGRTCRFHPTCSNYAIQALREYGVLKGIVLTVHRLFRCHPWGGHGYDPPRWFGEERSAVEMTAHESAARESDEDME